VSAIEYDRVTLLYLPKDPPFRARGYGLHRGRTYANSILDTGPTLWTHCAHSFMVESEPTGEMLAVGE